MKKSMILFFMLSIILASCVKFPEEENVVPAGAYQLKAANASLLGDTILVPLNTLVIFTLEKNGAKVVADFLFGNGTPVVTGDIVSTKYPIEGVYTVKATDLSVQPNVAKTAIVKVKKDVVIPPPVTGETSVITITSTYSGTTNTVTLGLRCSDISVFNPATPVNAEVQYETPSVPWTSKSLLASEIVTVANIKYYKWSFTVADNQKVRFGWLINTTWSYNEKNTYRQADGLSVIYFKAGVIYKEIQTAALPGSFGDAKVRGTLETITGVQNINLYLAKSLFNGGIPTIKYKIDNGSEYSVVLTEATDKSYYIFQTPILSGQELNFWPLSSSGVVDISDSTVWSTERLCGRIVVTNLKSTLSIILG